jgi:UDP:flavonoid glycosyltransferase YjiC (YdhE family)
MIQKGPVSVLLAPLDWGLGHATRCIPIINELIRQGARVTIAASEGPKALLLEEFPQLEFIEIPGYELSFKGGVLLKWALLWQIPAILKRVKKENRWLEETARKLGIHAVISDNRYGLFHKKLYCVFVTHQLNIQSGWGFHEKAGSWSRYMAGAVGDWIDRKILKWNYKFIGKFSVCWIPDLAEKNSLSGNLSHPIIPPPFPVKYIGVLSRFKKEEKKIISNSLLILISGPEPQRTEFENILFRQLIVSTMETVVVRGLPGAELPNPIIRDGLKIYNHLPADKLNDLMNASEFIIARSGYSTIMDLVTLKRNAVLVPTPGQTEQEYLARYMHENKWMFSAPQKNFNLVNILSLYQKTMLKLPGIPESNLNQLVNDFLAEVSKRDRD